MLKAFIKIISVVFLLVLVAVGGMQAQEFPEGLVLWNGLGSDQEVFNSFVGEDLALYTTPTGHHVPGDRAYVPGVVGGGVTPAGSSLSVDFVHILVLNNLPNVLNTERGTIEFWYNWTGGMPSYYGFNGYLRMFDGGYGLNAGIGIYVVEAGYKKLFWFSLGFGGNGCGILVDITEAPFAPYNTWVHLAACWDRNGIDGTADTLRLYADNQLIGSETKNDWGTTVGDRADLCSGNGSHLAGILKMDELKIWNYAKTNFDDPVGSDVADTHSIVAYNSVRIDAGCTVESGDVVVLNSTLRPYLSQLAQIAVYNHVHGHDQVAFKANSVYLLYGTTVYDVYANAIYGQGLIRHDRVTPLAMPLPITPPALPATAPGTQDVTVPAYQQLVLQPGSYGQITVNDGANLIFEGGTYHLNTLYVAGRYCGIYFRQPTEVNISDRMYTAEGMTMGPESAATDIKDIRINVHYVSGTPLGTEAVNFGPYAMVRAVVHAPNGTIHVKDGCTVEGTMIGKDVRVDTYVLLRLGY